MIIGELDIEEQTGVLHAPKDSHTLNQLTTVSVRRPFLPGAVIFSVGLGAIGVSFFDVLYPHERIAIIVFVTIAMIVGWSVGRLKLRSRELRSGDELADAVWGSFSTLNKKRRDIIKAVAATRGKGSE
ncbi:MAG: hypothetical protein ACE37E_11210 [Hyphomicrobiales bacterium]